MVTACLSSIVLNNAIQNNTKIFVTFLVFSPVEKVFKKVRNRCAECGIREKKEENKEYPIFLFRGVSWQDPRGFRIFR